MRASEAEITGCANVPTRQLAGRFPPIGGFIDAALRVARSLFPTNTAPEIAALTGYSVKNAEKVLAKKRRMSAEHALRLITSGEEGIEIFAEYVAQKSPEDRRRVWAALRRAARKEELRERLKVGREELEQLEQSESLRKSRR